MKYEVHPAADLLPPLNEEEFHSLRRNIQRHGILEAITLFEGKILDGRARYEISDEEMMKPFFVDIEVEDPYEYVLSKNLPHRKLTKAQLVASAMELYPLFSEAAMARRGRGGAGVVGVPEEELGATAEKLAAMFDVGRNSIERAVQISKAKPSLIPRMKVGEFPSIDAAMKAAGLFKSDGKHPRRRWRATREDGFYPILKTMNNYLDQWTELGLAHINPREAQKRLDYIEAMKVKLADLEGELEQRSVRARTTGV